MMRVQQAPETLNCHGCTDPGSILPGDYYLDLGPDPSADHTVTEPSALCLNHGTEAAHAMWAFAQQRSVEHPTEADRAAARAHLEPDNTFLCIGTDMAQGAADDDRAAARAHLEPDTSAPAPQRPPYRAGYCGFLAQPEAGPDPQREQTADHASAPRTTTVFPGSSS